MRKDRFHYREHIAKRTISKHGKHLCYTSPRFAQRSFSFFSIALSLTLNSRHETHPKGLRKVRDKVEGAEADDDEGDADENEKLFLDGASSAGEGRRGGGRERLLMAAEKRWERCICVLLSGFLCDNHQSIGHSSLEPATNFGRVSQFKTPQLLHLNGTKNIHALETKVQLTTTQPLRSKV